MHGRDSREVVQADAAAPPGERAAVNVSLTAAEMDRLKAAKTRTGWSYIDTIIRAAAAVREDPRSVLDADEYGDGDLGGFILSHSRRHQEPRRVHVWRTYQENVARIDKLVAAAGATSRDEFLRAALIRFLDEKNL